jgi:hypothetical protein
MKKRRRKKTVERDKGRYIYRHLEMMLNKESVSNCSSLSRDIRDLSLSLSLFPFSLTFEYAHQRLYFGPEGTRRPCVELMFHIERSRTRESSVIRASGRGYAPAGVTHPAGYSRTIDPAGYESTLRDADRPKSSADVSVRH